MLDSDKDFQTAYMSALTSANGLIAGAEKEISSQRRCSSGAWRYLGEDPVDSGNRSAAAFSAHQVHGPSETHMGRLGYTQ